MVACAEGSDDGTAAEDDADFNATDVVFSAEMLPHHQQGLQMAELAIEMATDPMIQELAVGIAETQRAEIETLQGFLDEYGEEPFTTALEVRAFRQAGASCLQALTGADFDEAFLRMMSAHHVQAVAEANFELQGGIDAEAQDIAEQIKQTQLQEVSEMSMLLEPFSP